MSLTPWDFSGLGMGFGLYRPRRPSYTFATQYNRQRSESYRYATRLDTTDVEEKKEDFIEDIMRKKRKESYLKATRRHSDVALNNVLSHPDHGHSSCEDPNKHNSCEKTTVAFVTGDNVEPVSAADEGEDPSTSEQGSSIPSVILFAFKKNLIVLCVSFILIFTSFRAIQNIQSSVNSSFSLGIITMSVLHGTMFLTCVFAPVIINILTAKWALAFGMLCHLIWFAANFYPSFYTLVPTALLAGMGQGILWTAEVSYVLKLAFDSARVTKDLLEHEMFRFHGIFLACFQTTQIWGNLISSVLIGERSTGDKSLVFNENMTYFTDDIAPDPSRCGVLHSCKSTAFSASVEDFSGVLWKLMCSYLVLGFIGFALILVLLDRIGARMDPEKSAYQMVMDQMCQLGGNKTFRLLVPLLVFTGLQQGFMFSDFNQYYVTCSLDVKYVGYVMITMGVASMLSTIVVAVTSNKLPREVVLGFGGIMHIALMIGLLIWIPEKNPVLFFVLAAAWGMCDAVWQTQCNTLICLTCTEDPDLAFANHRMLQSLGLTIAFGSGTFMCVSAKLYLLMSLLVIAIMFYVLAEYHVRQGGEDDDDVFEEQPT